MLRSLLVLAATLPLLAVAQPVQLKFHVEGPGAVITCCPEPNQVGQGYQLVAQPLPGARFVQWEDGSADPQRSFVLSASQIEFTAYFEQIPQVPYLVLHGLEGLNPMHRAWRSLPGTARGCGSPSFCMGGTATEFWAPPTWPPRCSLPCPSRWPPLIRRR